MIRFLLVGVLVLVVGLANADYLVTGKITGQECSGFVLEVCSNRNVDAVEGDNGKLYHLAEIYSDVDDYDGKRCWIRTKSKGLGLISKAIDAIGGDQFYEKEKDGRYVEIDVEYITFPCKRI